MPHLIKISLALMILVLAATLSSCSTLSYYRQSITGQLQLVRAQQDIQTILHAAKTPVELKQRLQNIKKIRDFASNIIGLPDNNSYRSYADIGRKYIVWNVFATPSLSFEPRQSCFLIVGCLSYRGYFKKENAVAYMKSLEVESFDVYLGGVAAYSTLGWFDDPILNGMLERNDIELARLIFHELSHQQLYIKDDTEFNEAFADTVALIGLEYWLEANTTSEQRREFEDQLARENQFIDLVLAYRDRLNQLYNSTIPDAQKHMQKTTLYKELQSAYEELRASWGGHDDYDEWFKHKLNNAKLAAISTYRKLVPLFFTTYETSGKDMKVFFSRVEKIGKCTSERRRQLLSSTSPIESC
jgi:predicted aminopeptidase